MTEVSAKLWKDKSSIATERRVLSKKKRSNLIRLVTFFLSLKSYS